MDVYALLLLDLGEAPVILISLAFGVVGFLLGMWRYQHSVFPMRRVPYVLFVGATTVALGLTTALSAFSMLAISYHLLWLITAVQFLCMLISGAMLAWAACGRALSAFGNSGKAWMALIPFVNLILFFAAPKAAGQDGASAPSPASAAVLNALGTVLGILLLGLANALPDLMAPFIQARTEQDARRPEIASAVLDLQIAAGKLESVLSMAAAGVSEVRVDEVTVLLGATATGNSLAYAYRLDIGVQPLDPSVRGRLAQNSCGDVGAMKLLAAGAELAFSFAYADGHPTSEFSVTLADCPAS